MKFWLLCLLIPLLLGCQQPEPPPTPLPDAQNTPFSDTQELLGVRLVLLNHLIQVEGITAVPLPPDWTPQQSHEDSNNRTYNFSSGDWQLDIDQPLTENLPYRYRVLVTGPDNFRYAADISADSIVSPAQ